jgi:sensor histidine kinase regulating citrate/malate metabolism
LEQLQSGARAGFESKFFQGVISDVKFDDSTQAYLVQVSVPVKDADKVIGAITVGIDVEKLK